MSSYCAISPTSSAPCLRRRATTSSMSSTANMMRRMPSVFAGALSGSALTAGGVWNFVSSSRLWPSGVRIMAMSARTSLSPTTRSTQRPSSGASPSSSIPSSAKNALAASRSSTTMRTLSIRSNLLFMVIFVSSSSESSFNTFREKEVSCIRLRESFALGHRAACLRRAYLGLLVEDAVLHDREQLGGIAEDRQVREWIAVHQQEVGEVAVLELAQLAAHHHDLAAVAGGREQGLHRGHPDVFHEVLQIARVLAVGREGEAVVAAGQHADAALVHLAERVGGRGQLGLVAHLDRLLAGDAPRRRVIEHGDQDADARGHEVLVPVGLEHVERFLVGEAR